jgi:ribosomal protein S18 acetylase RimI-like enzyme
VDLHVYSGQEARDVMGTPENDERLSELCETLEKTTERGGDIRENVAHGRERVHQMLANDQMYVGTTGEEVVSVLGYELVGVYEGRPHFEIRNAVTHPNHQRQGHYRQLVQRCYADIKAQYPNAFVVTITNNDNVVQRCESDALKEIPIREWSHMHWDGWPNIDEKEEGGYRVFLYDIENFKE